MALCRVGIVVIADDIQSTDYWPGLFDNNQQFMIVWCQYYSKSRIALLYIVKSLLVIGFIINFNDFENSLELTYGSHEVYEVDLFGHWTSCSGIVFFAFDGPTNKLDG